MAENKCTYPQRGFLELVHCPELLEPVENNVVKWRVRCVSILFDPWVIYKQVEIIHVNLLVVSIINVT